MTVTTEFLISSPSLPLVSLAESLSSDRIECVHGLCLEHDSRVFVVYLDPADDLTETALCAYDEIVEATSLGRSSGKDVYQVTVELADVVSEAFAPERFTAAQMEPTIVTPEGWYEKKLFEDYHAFNGLTNRCEEYGIDIELISISQDSSAPGDSSTYGLTDRQYEALTLAVSRGYFESPRRTSTAELAEEMGISQPSMSSLLRRAERQLLTATLGSRPRPESASE
ncbi:putative DNA binding protein [Halarchaeum rubridurum]|uniref:Helix-turn-helix domain-containing protein n=1 Tax=Halarchaeum rubridurum TaxID=489911 RepID=A0A830FYY8_9EURY|nr:helix-turn-helix domain-containing protein [Halarchaeum rubridurum]MBP1953466.1 putative DNA binding protein [Halarchaeum rubridurum]GGM65057.1 helix-turn-helix domain-containing protein [Halarchaeum rubridurum]